MSISTIGNKGYASLMEYGSFSAKPLYWDEVDSTDLNHIPDREMVDKYLSKVEVVEDYLDDKIFRNNPDLGNGATEDNYILHDMDKDIYYFVDTQGYDYPRYVSKLIGFTEKMAKGGGVASLKWIKRGDSHFANGKNKYTIEKMGSSYTLYVGGKAESKGGLRVMKAVAQDKEKVKMANGGVMEGGGEVRTFDRHEQMDSDTRGEILDTINEFYLIDGFRNLQNYLYGLFDGYDYSKTNSFKETMNNLKSVNESLRNRIEKIYKKIDKYSFKKYSKGGDLDTKTQKFLDAVRLSDNKIQLKDLSVEASPKGNWVVYNKGRHLMVLNSSMLDEDTIRKHNLEHHDKMEDGGGVDDVVYFAVDDDSLDGKLHTKYDNVLDYLEVGSDVYYILPQKQFDRFMDDAFSMGLDESIEKVDKNGRYLDEYVNGGETEDLEEDDRVKVVYGNQFYGETGTIVEIKRGFVIVEMDSDGREYSMHISDVEKIEDEDEDDDDYAKGGEVSIVPQGGDWFNGTYGDLKFNAKLNSTDTHYGINGGKVIKLLIRKGDKIIANYDRGWDIKPKGANNSAYNHILKALADKKYEMGGKTPEMPNGGQIMSKTHKLHR